MLLLLISLIAGMLTVLAPCVLPLLPVIVGGSLSGKTKDKFRPYVITFSLAISVILFTLILKVSTLLINLSPNALNYLSGSILIILGIVSLVPELWEKAIIAINFQSWSQRFLGKSENNKSRYAGPILIGLSLGPVFSSCSPTYAFILASILPHSFGSGLIYLTAYSLGLVITLLATALIGKKLISRFAWAVDTHSLFRRLIGFIFILIGVVIITNRLVSVETWVANHLPFDETKIERVLLSKQNKSSLDKTIAEKINNSSALNVQPTLAPQFVGLTNWINSKPQQLSNLKGHVVLVDFWTYSCINCIRSIPYVEKWYQAYKAQGFVVVGVSTPEFAFEHNPANVQAAVKRFGITYPVALDNNYDTWNAFQNDSWPADYLIDQNGYIRYVSLGEGDYGQTNQAIEQLLGTTSPLVTPTSNVPISASQTNETYFGAERESDYQGSPGIQPGSYSYTPATSLASNNWTLSGLWNEADQSISSGSSNSTLSFNFNARNVYVVAGSNQPLKVGIKLGSGLGTSYGSDDQAGNLVVNGYRLYNIVNLPAFKNGTVTLNVPPGVSLYTLTFGS